MAFHTKNKKLLTINEFILKNLALDCVISLNFHKLSSFGFIAPNAIYALASIFEMRTGQSRVFGLFLGLLITIVIRIFAGGK